MAGHEVNFRDFEDHKRVKFFQEVATLISTEWAFVGRYLRLSDAALTQLEMNHRGNQREINYAMLIEWYQNADRAMTTNVFLATALKAAGRTDLHDWVMEKCNKSQ